MVADLQARRNLVATTAYSFVAGWVDTLGYLALGLFTTHVTGNFVLMFVGVNRTGELGKVLSIPVFVSIAACCSLAVTWRGAPGRGAVRALQAAQAALLAAFMLAGAWVGAPQPGTSSLPLLVGMVGVAAMAVQNAVNRLGVPPGPSTTVMTVNLSQVAVDVARLARSPADHTVRERLRLHLPAVVAFAIGCAGGAGGYALA
ncbi:MAG: DUF1275 family protein, partial [Acetobacteraceae bacterium]